MEGRKATITIIGITSSTATVSGRRLSRRLFQIVSSVLVALAGLACVTWGCAVLPIFLQGYNVQRIAPRIINGQSFDTKLIESLLPPALEHDACQASVRTAEAMVRLRLFETAVAQTERTAFSDTLRSLREAVVDALRCSPTQPFLWFLRYWLETAENGFNSKSLRYLSMSYLTGPNEGWISAKRNGFSLAIYDQLPEDLAAKVVPEFVSLVRSGFYSQAVANLSGPGWPKREMLLSALAAVPEGRKYQFARYLRAEGLYLDVPGVPPIDRRPWN